MPFQKACADFPDLLDQLRAVPHLLGEEGEDYHFVRAAAQAVRKGLQLCPDIAFIAEFVVDKLI